MSPKSNALIIILSVFAGFLTLLLSGCTGGYGHPSVCLRTDYGTLCYELPMPTSSK